MKAVIVAKTHMGQNLCVGAASAEDGLLLRLIPRDGAEYHSWQSFDPDVGDLITISGTNSDQIDPPHTEDFLVDKFEPTGKRAKDLSRWIESRCTVWTGGRESLFDHKLHYTSTGKGHVFRSHSLPSCSVGFWQLPANFRLQPGTKRYLLQSRQPVRVPFVGLGTPPDTIHAGSIVRVSLARWWAPADGSIPEGCWLQLSGWY